MLHQYNEIHTAVTPIRREVDRPVILTLFIFVDGHHSVVVKKEQKA